MRIECKCGGEEFQANVPATVVVFTNSSGEIRSGIVGEVFDVPTHAGQENEYICTSCGDEATVYP